MMGGAAVSQQGGPQLQVGGAGMCRRPFVILCSFDFKIDKFCHLKLASFHALPPKMGESLVSFLTCVTLSIERGWNRLNCAYRRAQLWFSDTEERQRIKSLANLYDVWCHRLSTEVVSPAKG